MNETYIPGFSNTLRSGSLRRFAVGGRADDLLREGEDLGSYATPSYYQPTPQPVQAAPYYALEPVQATPAIDLGDWSYKDVAGLQNLFFPNGAPPVNGTPEEQAAWQAENARTPDQFWADLRASKAAEMASTNPYSNSGLDAINYNIWNSVMPQETGEIFRFDTGNDIGVPDGQGGWTYRNAGQVMFLPGETYQMTDKSGKVIGTASTPEEMAQLVAKSSDVPFYNLERTVSANPGVDLGGMMPSKTDAGSLGSMLTNMAALALPAVGGAALGPVLAGGLGTSAAVGTGLGTALGTAAAGTAAGKSIEDILLQSALAGLTAGGLSSLGGTKPNIGDLQTQVIDGTMSLAQATNALKEAGATASQIAQFASDVGSVASSAFPTVIGNVAGGAVGSGVGSVGSAIAGAGLGALSGANTTSGQQPSQEQPTGGGGYNAPAAGLDDAGNLITVTGSKLPSSVLDRALAAAATAPGTVNYGDKVFNQPEQPEQPLAEEEQPGWDVVAPKENLVVPPPASLPEIIPPLASVTIPPLAGTELPNVPEQPPAEEEQPGWDVVANSEPRAPNLLPEIVPPITSVDIPANAGDVTPTEDKGGLSTSDYIRLASLGISTIGKLFGGSGQQQGATISGAMSGLNPVFSKQLPTANIPGLTAATAGARAPSQSGLNTTQDWYRYGYGPEQSFFNYVPMAQRSTSQAYTGYAEGGFAVEGAGDGRDDKIPAMLSDGEYVIDAETVALLGNGSSKAGADLLDKFRVNVRKHKGQQLAKGEFSDDAKRPEHYLAGGRM